MNFSSQKMLALAKQAAIKAGSFLHSYKREKLKVLSEHKKDIKISLDIAAEKIILNVLSRSNLPALSEEKGLVGVESDLMWIVDPLDGSMNYSRGIPLTCVSIALCRGKQPLLGVVYDFYRQEMFYGIVGKGAWLNGKPISVSKIDDVNKSVLATGFPSKANYSRKALGEFVEFVRNFKKVRLFGSAALSLAYVAGGRVDAYTEREIMFWDVAGGLALVAAAGGKYQLTESKKNEHACVVYAHNGRLS